LRLSNFIYIFDFIWVDSAFFSVIREYILQISKNKILAICIMPSTFAGGVRRLIFTGNVKTNLDNKYVGGAGVGAHSTAARRALKRRATSSKGSLGPNNTLVDYSNHCCNSEIGNTTTIVNSSNTIPIVNISIQTSNTNLMYH